MALAKRSGWMLLATAVVLGDYIVHADGHFPHVFGLGVVPSAALMGAALYVVGTTAVLTLGLMRHGSMALMITQDGVALRSAWSAKTFAWSDLSTIALDVRYTRSSRYTVVTIRETAGLMRCHAVDTRLLAETFDQVNDWTTGAEHQRIARGGTAYAAPSMGLAGYMARRHAADLAAEVADSRKPDARRPWNFGAGL